MTTASFVRKTLVHYWRTNLAVCLGVIIGTAVLTGALIVGDSVRGSLRDMTLVRLGGVDYVLTGDRFFREKLADDFENPDTGGARLAFRTSAPGIVMLGSIETPLRQSAADSPAADGANSDQANAAGLNRAGQVQVYGIDGRFWNVFGEQQLVPPVEREVYLSAKLAAQLRVRVGDPVTVQLEVPAAVPRESLLGKRDETAVDIPLTVKQILPEASGLGRFGLEPNQQLPLNAFVSLRTLQDRLGFAERGPSRKQPQGSLARVNTIFVNSTLDRELGRNENIKRPQFLLMHFRYRWQLSDFHLRVVPNENFGYVSVESERMILEPAIVTAVNQVAGTTPHNPSLVYIANEIAPVVDGKVMESPDAKKPRYSRYSVVAGVEPAIFATDSSRATSALAKAFGPYEFLGEGPQSLLDEGELLKDGIGEIVMNDWLAKDLEVREGDLVALKYHTVGSRGELPEETRQFRVRGILKLQGTRAEDRGLTPEVAGITDVKSFDEWEAPFPMKKVTKRDDEYWDKYRATPKAFVSLKTARHLWSSRYGDTTSVRIARMEGKGVPETAKIVEEKLLAALEPAGMGLVFQPVKDQGLRAASGTTDFSGLFLGFSFFLILSAVILIGLLFRLGIERRAAQVGVLLATGYSVNSVQQLLRREAVVVLVVGAIVGTLAAVGYAQVMVYGLKTWWVGAIGTRFLEVHVTPMSLLLGGIITVGVALGAIWWGMRLLRGVSIRGLLAGVTQVALSDQATTTRRQRARRVSWSAGCLAVLLSLGVMLGLVPNVEAFAGFSWPTICFFVVGLAALVTGLSALAAWLDSQRAFAVRGRGWLGLLRLGVRNAARNRSRSVMTVGLMSVATFLIVAIAAGHRNPAVERPERNSGNGGFALVAESAVPVLHDPNTREGQSELGLEDAESRRRLAAVQQIVPFRVNSGENASCLNIYQTSQPTILGVPAEMIERGGFKFADTRVAEPWKLLDEESTDGTIPTLGDMNTLMYSLKKGIGSTLEIRDGNHQPVTLKVQGMFDGSVFQGVLLISEKHFLKLFPQRTGYQYFLVDVPLDAAGDVTRLLETKLAGFDAEPVGERLERFLAVQNTYLSTFQSLGGLGLLLGTLGLGTVMLRNVFERRAELALLRAVGFRPGGVAGLVFLENTFLLLWGLVSGTASALCAMLPHLMSTGADVPWEGLAAVLGGVLVTGMLAALWAVRAAARLPILATLRSE